MQKISSFFTEGPWWLRIPILIIIGLPLVNQKLVTDLLPPRPLDRVAMLTLYAIIIWTFVVIVAGLQRLVGYLSAAFSMVIATVVVGGAVRAAVGLGGNSLIEKLSITEHLIDVFFMTVTSVPYLCFSVQSFSASSLVEGSFQSRSRWSTLKVHVAVALRVFQRLIEVIPNLLIVWREEFPEIVLPRSRSDWRQANWWMWPVKLVDWMAIAFFAWACCLLITGLRIVPSIDDEAKRLLIPRKALVAGDPS